MTGQACSNALGQSTITCISTPNLGETSDIPRYFVRKMFAMLHVCWPKSVGNLHEINNNITYYTLPCQQSLATVGSNNTIYCCC